MESTSVYAFMVKDGDKEIDNFYQVKSTSIEKAKEELSKIFPGCTFYLKQIGNSFWKCCDD